MPHTPLRALRLSIAALALVACIATAPTATAQATFDHSAFNAVVARYVDARGLVDYAGLKRDCALDPYLATLNAARPGQMSESEQIAFWINAYNAGAMKVVVDRYPVRSILRITPSGFPIIVPGTDQSPFKIRFLDVAGETRTLDEIEHAILRKDFKEPRIHSALVCAAISCPPLRREAYSGARLDAQLDDQMRTWLNDTTKNRIGAGQTAQLSQILNWFKADFGGSDASVQRYIARYFTGDVAARLSRAGYRVSHMSYDWDLNDAGRR